MSHVTLKVFLELIKRVYRLDHSMKTPRKELFLHKVNASDLNVPRPKQPLELSDGNTYD